MSPLRTWHYYQFYHYPDSVEVVDPQWRSLDATGVSYLSEGLNLTQVEAAEMRDQLHSLASDLLRMIYWEGRMGL